MVKKTFFLLAILAILLFHSCKKDGNENDNNGSSPINTNNYFEYNGQTYDLSKSFVIEYGPYDKDDVYEFDIYLYSGMTIYNPDSVVGSGNIIGFCIYSPASSINSGTYSYSLGYGQAYTYCVGHFQLQYNSSSDWIYTNGGEVSISVDENNRFDVSFDCMIEPGQTIKGRYIGTPVFYDDTGWK